MRVIPADKWYCPGCLPKQQGQDCLRNYSIGLTWNGLLDLAHRDAIREADGMAMISFWRINMSRFWTGNHYKYMKLSHRLIAGTFVLFLFLVNST